MSPASARKASHRRNVHAMRFKLKLAVFGALLAAYINSAAAAAPARGATVNCKGQPLLTPSKLVMLNRDVYYEIPVQPIGVLAMFHGCAHDASDGWPRASCPECDGLPEEVAHTKQALARGYAVVAIDAIDSTRCFSWNKDRADVVAILQYWLQLTKLQNKPLYVVGVSSGASFALKLPREIKVQGVISEVLGVLPEAWNIDEIGGSYPPTAFISMPRDTKTAEKIAAGMALLRQYGVPTDVITVPPQRLTSTWISDRSELIAPELSAKVVDALKAIGLVDADNMLTQDPRYTLLPWREQLQQLVPEMAASSISLTPDASHVTEELNRAYAMHEITADYLTACLAWLESRGTIPLSGLVQQFADMGLPPARLRDLSPQRILMMPMRSRKLAVRL